MQEINKHSNLKIWIPDTIVYNDNCAPFWVYCSDEGYVYKTENFNEKHIHMKMGNPDNLDEVVAVVKFIEFDESNHMGGHQTTAITTQDIYLQLQSYNSSNGRACAIQRFVKCNGPNAFVCRTAWFKDQPNECWVITNKKSYKEEFITNPRAEINACSIVYSRRGKHLQQTTVLVERLIQFIQKYTRLEFTEMVADFTKDEDGNWWLLNVRGFKLVNPLIRPKLKVFTGWADEETNDKKENSNAISFQGKQSKNLRTCMFCKVGFLMAELTNKLTLKMIIDMEKMIRHMGINISWLDFSDSKFYEKSLFYQTFRVCNSCTILYKALKELKLTELKIAQALGIPQNPEIEDIIEQNQITGMMHTKTNKVNNLLQSTKQRYASNDWSNPLDNK